MVEVVRQGFVEKQQSELLLALSRLRVVSTSRHITLSMIVCAMLLSLKPFFAMATSEFTLNPKGRIEGIIGAGGVNRIQVSGSEIMEVVGDESKYSLYWSGDWRNLFITPKTGVGETVDVSLILIGGQAQDMRLTVGDVESQTIFLVTNTACINSATNAVPDCTKYSGSQHSAISFLSDHSFKHSYSKALSDKQLKLEIASMMRAMIEDIQGKYYVNILKRTITKNKEMLITQSKSYRYKDLSGARLTIKNLTSKPILLSKEHIGNLFKGFIAINLPTTTLPPRSKTSAFIITRDNREEK
jgi:hypothetical protein